MAIGPGALAIAKQILCADRNFNETNTQT